jgi:hypothetical protein
MPVAKVASPKPPRSFLATSTPPCISMPACPAAQGRGGAAQQRGLSRRHAEVGGCAGDPTNKDATLIHSAPPQPALSNPPQLGPPTSDAAHPPIRAAPHPTHTHTHLTPRIHPPVSASAVGSDSGCPSSSCASKKVSYSPMAPMASRVRPTVAPPHLDSAGTSCEGKRGEAGGLRQWRMGWRCAAEQAALGMRRTAGRTACQQHPGVSDAQGGSTRRGGAQRGAAPSRLSAGNRHRLPGRLSCFSGIKASIAHSCGHREEP